jgi:hypothetical protein
MAAARCGVLLPEVGGMLQGSEDADTGKQKAGESRRKLSLIAAMMRPGE